MKIKKIIKNFVTMYYIKEMIFVSPCRRTLIKLIVFSFSLTLVFFIFSTVHIIESQYYMSTDIRTMRYSTDLKYILFWRRSMTNGKGKVMLHKESKFQEGQKMFIKQRCKFINCFITYDKHLLRKDHRNFDAVVFNSREIVDLSPNEIDLTRSIDQKYIFRSLQFPKDYPICNPFYDNFFNWTWTYKLDSDIPQPFIYIYNSDDKLVGPKKDMNWTKVMDHNTRFVHKISKKTKGVAWIVNKCKTKIQYQEFVRELNKELRTYNYTIDIYGTCGDNKCPESRIINCFKMMEKNYFFQLIMEDTFAEDYVSEKMVKAMTRIVIPIVLGPSDYHNFLPPGSYINAQSFDMKKLGAVIDYLIRNPAIYGYFFDWKNYYYYTVRPRTSVCDLCEKLNKFNDTNTPTVYNNFRNWWNTNYRNDCQNRFNNRNI